MSHITSDAFRSNEGTDVPSTRCPPDPFVLVTEKSKCIDQQTLKLQEAPDSVPVGELPRHILLTVDRYASSYHDIVVLSTKCSQALE